MIIIVAFSLLVTQICSSNTSFVFCLNVSVPDGCTLDRELRQYRLDSGVSGKSTNVLIEGSWKTSAEEHVVTLYVHQHSVAKDIKEPNQTGPFKSSAVLININVLSQINNSGNHFLIKIQPKHKISGKEDKINNVDCKLIIRH